MHCLYCDRPLAFLHRLTGDGEFCSRDHRRLYYQQHSQMALARLLRAQPGQKSDGQDEIVGGKASSKRGLTQLNINDRRVPEPVNEEPAPILVRSEAPEIESIPESPASPATPNLDLIPAGPIGGQVEMIPRVSRHAGPPAARCVHPISYPGPGSSASLFLGPGAFLTRRIQAVAPESNSVVNRRRFRPVPFALPAPGIGYLEDCLNQTERIGLAPLHV